MQPRLRVDHRVWHDGKLDLVGHFHPVLSVDDFRAVKEHAIFARLALDESESFKNFHRRDDSRFSLFVFLRLCGINV